MKTFKAGLITLVIAVMVINLSVHAQKKEIIAYYPEWGVKGLRYYAKHIEKSGAAEKLTTLIYAFCYPALDSTGQIVPMFMNSYQAYQQPYSAEMSIDGKADDSIKQVLRGQFNQLRKLKARHPNIKILISIGGWTGSNYFSDAAVTPEAREKFVSAVVDRYILGNLPLENNAGGTGAASGVFDGIDIDWEYPLRGGVEGIHHNEKDNDNLTELFALFRKKLDEVKPGLLLTAAVPASENLARNYNISKDQEYLDWYNIMTYDYRGSWSKTSGHHSNLFSSFSPESPDGMKESLDYAVRFFRDTLGVESKKIVIGAAFYGRGWQTKDSLNYGLYREGEAAAGIYESGYNYYADLSGFTNQGYIYNWDNAAMAPTLFNSRDKIFWSLDDEKSVALKSRYADAYKLRGVMFWEISGDDSSGSLINAIYNGEIAEKKSDRIYSDKLVSAKKTSGNKSSDKEFLLKKIKITSPSSAVKLLKGSSVVITTDASEQMDKITKVEFFADNISLGFDNRSPYSWAWFNIPAGRHTLKVIATDISGKKVSSKSVMVKVK